MIKKLLAKLFKKSEEDKKPTGNNGLMGRPVQWGDDH